MVELCIAGLELKPVPRSFVSRSTVDVARDLVGCLLAVQDPDGLILGRIVETEAYAGADDPASHAAKRRSGRVTVMWGEPGRAYVYTSYGLHSMLNVVAKADGGVGAVLVRALEPLAGEHIMRARRVLVPEGKFCSGPGLLCRAAGITGADHGCDMIGGHRLMLAMGNRPERLIASERIGIRCGRELPWRFFDGDSKSVSAHRRGISL